MLKNPGLLSRRLAVAVICLGAAASSLRAAEDGKAPGYHLDATWKIGGVGGWDYLTVDPEAHRLYLTRGDRVEVIDTEKGTAIAEIPGLDGGHGVAIVPEVNRGFATSGKSNSVLMFDLATLKAVGAPITVGKKPDAIVL